MPGRIVEAPPPGRRVAPDRRLGGDAETALARLPLPGEEAADHALRQAPAVDVRGVDMVDPEVERRREERVRLLLRRLPVDPGEGHRPDPDRRNLRPAGPQPALLHFTAPACPAPAPRGTLVSVIRGARRQRKRRFFQPQDAARLAPARHQAPHSRQAARSRSRLKLFRAALVARSTPQVRGCQSEEFES